MLSLDIAATALDPAGLPAAEDADGISMLEWIDDPSRDDPHDKIFWRMPGGKMAFRWGTGRSFDPSVANQSNSTTWPATLARAATLSASSPKAERAGESVDGHGRANGRTHCQHAGKR